MIKQYLFIGIHQPDVPVVSATAFCRFNLLVVKSCTGDSLQIDFRNSIKVSLTVSAISIMLNVNNLILKINTEFLRLTQT